MDSEVVMFHKILQQVRECHIGTINRVDRHVVDSPKHREAEGSILAVDMKRAGGLVSRGSRSGHFFIFFVRFLCTTVWGKGYSGLARVGVSIGSVGVTESGVNHGDGWGGCLRGSSYSTAYSRTNGQTYTFGLTGTELCAVIVSHNQPNRGIGM